MMNLNYLFNASYIICFISNETINLFHFTRMECRLNQLLIIYRLLLRVSDIFPASEVFYRNNHDRLLQIVR